MWVPVAEFPSSVGAGVVLGSAFFGLLGILQFLVFRPCFLLRSALRSLIKAYTVAMGPIGTFKQSPSGWQHSYDCKMLQ